MRTGFSFSALPDGAFDSACTGTPSSRAARSTIGRADGACGTQIAPAPSSSPPTLSAFFIQYTSQFAFSSRFITTNELFTWWLIRYPAGLAGPLTVDGGGGSSPAIFVKGPSKPSSTRSYCTPICIASVHPVMSYGGLGGPPG